MNILVDLKAKADTNGDGKVDINDLRDLQEKHPEASDRLAPIIKQADANGDGKVSVEDVTKVLGGLKDGAGDLFGKAGKILKI